jgi:lipid-binding SYLF domain-containing protein
MKKVFGLLMLCLMFVAGCSHRPSSQSSAATPADKEKNRSDVVARLDDSAKVLNELMGAGDSAIPEKILSGAKCVMVVPSMIKGGFVIGGRQGRGEVTCRTANGWSAPAFATISGGSWGAQIGVESVDLVLLFMNEKGAARLLQDNFKIGGEASIAAGPIGRDVSADTDVKLNSEILTYSRTRGLFAGLELSGASVRPDDDSTFAIYGRKPDFKTILSGGVPTPAGAQQFISTVRKQFRDARGQSSSD